MGGDESMRRRLVVIFTLALFASISTLAWAEWYPVLIHSHCRDFSDGALTASQVIKTAKKMGYAALIETDHYKSIFKKGGQTPQAFVKYRQAFSSQDGIIVIPGAEVNTATAHILALGDIVYDEELLRLYGQENAQQAVLDRLKVKALGFLTVAAHPSLILPIGTETWRGDMTDYSFDMSQTRGIDGFELLNDGTDKGYDLTLKRYLNYSSNNPVFVTAGCDQHGTVNPALDDRWQRITWVWIDGPLTKESLLEALRQGRTYAARAGVKIVEINYRPGFEPQPAPARPELHFALVVPDVKQPPTVAVYRDGARVGTAFGYQAKAGTFYYFWVDGGVWGTTARYVLEVENCLVTSPIILEVPPFDRSLGRLDGWEDRDRNGHNPADVIREYFASQSPKIKGLLADPQRFPSLAPASFTRASDVQKIAEGLKRLECRSTCDVCSRVYGETDVRMSDVHFGYVETSGKRHCSTWFMILQDNEWRIRAVVEDWVNAPSQRTR